MLEKEGLTALPSSGNRRAGIELSQPIPAMACPVEGKETQLCSYMGTKEVIIHGASFSNQTIVALVPRHPSR